MVLIYQQLLIKIKFSTQNVFTFRGHLCVLIILRNTSERESVQNTGLEDAIIAAVLHSQVTRE